MPPIRHRRQSALTLIELVIVIAVLGALAAIALPSYRTYIERTKIAQAIKDVAQISMAIARYYTVNSTFPPDLAGVGEGLPSPDPWGNPYQYLGIDVDPAPHAGDIRRDRNMNPLNSDYDLYSMGPDGRTQKQLTARWGRDDIVRAGNGGFIGVAKDH
jgi:general secretion pathway protein G